MGNKKQPRWIDGRALRHDGGNLLPGWPPQPDRPDVRAKAQAKRDRRAERNLRNAARAK